MAVAELLGRGTELGTLTGLLEEAARGEQRVALVCGDPGIGKTTLVEALDDMAAEAGFVTVWGRCWEGGGGAPYWPWVQVLRACLRNGGDALLASIGAGRAELGRLLPELGSASQTPSSADSDDARLPLFLAVAELLDAATGSGLIVALDDLHDADEGSLQLLRFLARRRVRSPLFIVGTYRVVEVARSPAHQRALSAVAAHGPTIRLHGLSPDDVAVLVERAGGGVPAARASEVFQATDGNPFLVYEASRLLGAGRTRTTLLQQAGASLIQARLDPLPPRLRLVLEAAAVLGREFTLAVLSPLCELSTDELLDLLAEGSRLHVVEEAGLGRWTFSHSLLRDELLRHLDPDGRVRLHRRAAEVLQSESEDDTGATVAAIAHHLIEGRDPGAVDGCARAAKSAIEALAFEDAALWYERALALWESGSVAERRRYELLLDLGEALLQAGDVTRAIEAHDRAIKAGQALGSVELAAEAAIRIAPFTATDPLVIGALDDALCDLPDADSGLRARVLVSFAQALMTSSIDRTVLADVSRQGLDMARRVGDDETLWTVLTQWHQFAQGIFTPADRAERLRASEELLRLAEAASAPRRAVEARIARARDLLNTGQPQLARAEVEDCIQICRELRQPVLERTAQLVLVDVLWFVGDIRKSEEVLGGLLNSHSVIDADVSESQAVSRLLTLRRVQGRFEELEILAGQSIERWTPYGLQCSKQIGHVIAAAELGRTEEARALRDQAVRGRLVKESFGITTPYGWVPAPRLCCPSALVEASCLLGDREAVEALYERLLPHAENFSTEWGIAARFLGLAATALGRYDEADAHFRLAHLVAEGLGARLWAAQGRLDHGRMLVERGDPADRERAAELLDSAREAFEAMGIVVFAGRAAELLDRVRPPVAPVLDGARLVEEGEYWTFHYDGHVARLRDTKGLRYLARLLRSPGEEVPAIELADSADPELARQSVSRAIKTAVERLADAHPALGDHLRSTLRTGVVSAYVPDPRAPISWDG